MGKNSIRKIHVSKVCYMTYELSWKLLIVSQHVPKLLPAFELYSRTWFFYWCYTIALGALTGTNFWALEEVVSGGRSGALFALFFSVEYIPKVPPHSPTKTINFDICSVRRYRGNIFQWKEKNIDCIKIPLGDYWRCCLFLFLTIEHVFASNCRITTVVRQPQTHGPPLGLALN